MPPHPDDRLFRALAIAIVEHPRGTLKDLAEASGISKATLHRYCGTRENLHTLVNQHATQSLSQILDNPAIQDADPLTVLRQLISDHLQQREFLLFLIFQCRPDTYLEDLNWQHFNSTLDAFFLRGQQCGVFRIDIAAPVLTELFTASICSMVDAERRGRAAASDSARVLEQFFLRGAATS